MASENVVTAANLPDDLVVEILSRVPFKSFCRFKCVCKAWLAFSSDPHYRQKLPKIPSFLHQGQSGTSAIQLVSLSPNKNIDGALTFVPQYEQLHLVDCCNGLVLCLYKSSCSSADTCSFIVCNPATREWRILPVPESHSHSNETGHCGCFFTAFLAFDPSWSEQFYVFNIRRHHWLNGTSKLEVFSSDLSTWLVYDEWTRIRNILVNKPHSFIRGILHVQLDSMDTLVVEGLQAMSSSVAPHHSIIKMPGFGGNGCFGQSSAGFLQCAIPGEKYRSIEVFSFGDKWSLKHRLNMQNAFGRRVFRCIYTIVALDLERGSLFLFERDANKLLVYDIDTRKLTETTATRHSGLLGRHTVLLAVDSEEDEEESIVSWGLTEDCGYNNFSDHTAEEDGVCSSDSMLFRRARDLYDSGVDDEAASQLSWRGGGQVRGDSKENLQVEVWVAAVFAGKCSHAQDPPWSTACMNNTLLAKVKWGGASHFRRSW